MFGAINCPNSRDLSPPKFGKENVNIVTYAIHTLMFERSVQELFPSKYHFKDYYVEFSAS